MMSVIYLGNRERSDELNAELKKVIAALKKVHGVQKVILFGSLANGNVGIKSDLDLLIVQETEKAFLSRSIELMEYIDPNLAMDILVYTPLEFAEMQKSPNCFFSNILRNGRIVYAK
ncbi:MAG: nucleotidyltransferase domain-containing protein [Dethiobacter sp.]|jgi:predicted nucleotidyltransferase|nr:nucleotidyltransferase domain-containing protein [Dethiobacter sp.]